MGKLDHLDQYYGQKCTGPLHEGMAKALELFATFKSETPLYPSGERKGQNRFANCK